MLTNMAAIGNSCFWLVDFLKSSSLKLLSQMNRSLVGSTYGRFCIKFPQSTMKGERHRLSPLSLYCSSFSFGRCVLLDIKYLERQIRQQLKKRKTFVMGIHPFNSHVYLDISRFSKSPKCSSMVCLICNYLPSLLFVCNCKYLY
jgi:hypothetical protein